MFPADILAEIQAAFVQSLHKINAPQRLHSVSTQLRLRMQAVTNARVYQVQFCVAAGPWQEAGLFLGTRDIVLKHLAPGTVYTVRVRDMASWVKLFRPPAFALLRRGRLLRGRGHRSAMSMPNQITALPTSGGACVWPAASAIYRHVLFHCGENFSLVPVAALFLRRGISCVFAAGGKWRGGGDGGLSH